MIKISERLKLLGDIASEFDSAADIGTDHAYLPMYLYENGMRKLVISDINEGPLRKAQENLKAYRNDTFWDIRLGSGLSVLKPRETECIIIAGMGGDLISDILKEQPKVSRAAKALILNPRSRSSELRKWLVSNDYIIEDEYLVKEAPRICQIIKAAHCSVSEKEGEKFEIEADFHVAPLLFKKKEALLRDILEHKLEQANTVINELKNSENYEENQVYIDFCSRQKAFSKALNLL